MSVVAAPVTALKSVWCGAGARQGALAAGSKTRTTDGVADTLE
jgi:hypothetical protein